MSEPPQGGKRAVGGDLIIPVAALLFTVYYFVSIADAPFEAQINAFFVGTALIALVLVFLAGVARDLARGRATLGLGPLAEPVALVPKRLGLLALTAGYILLIQWAGFTLTTFVFLVLAMYWLGARSPAVVFGLAFGLATLGYVVFIAVFDTRFPKGPVERLLEWAF